MDQSKRLPKVGILIANYNYGRYLQGCLDSCIKQTYEHCDILVVDSNSQDNSVDILDNFSSSYEKIEEKAYYPSIDSSHIGKICPEIKECNVTRFKLNDTNNLHIYKLAENPGGPSSARNMALADSLPFIDAYQILDADDELYNNKVNTLVHTIYRSPHIVGGYADYDILNIDTGNIIREYKQPYDRLRLMQECIIHSGSLIKKEIVMSVTDQFGIYDREMRTCEDWDLWLRMAEKGIFVHVPESLTLVRVHNQNATNSVDKEIWNRNWQRIQQKISTKYRK